MTKSVRPPLTPPTMKTNYRIGGPRSDRNSAAMQQQAEGLKATQPDPGKFVNCGKLRIDRDGLVGYLKTGRIAQREAFFDSLTHGTDYGSVYRLREAFRQFSRKT
jgi:hypothetical protein